MIKLNEFLRGYRGDIDNFQVVGNMMVLPIVSDRDFSVKFGDVTEVQLSQDRQYGEMIFTNKSDRIGILLQGASIITRQRAQDRTVPLTKLVKGLGSIMSRVFCIQSTQSGYIDGEKLDDEFKDDSHYRMLPPELRQAAIDAGFRGNGYDGIWKNLEQYTATFPGFHSTSHLVDLYDHFDRSLNEFVAQFEPVYHQLGSITIVDGELIAIDILPTYSSWACMWRTFIRDSYGLEALRTVLNKSCLLPDWKFKQDGVNTIAALREAVKDAKEDAANIAKTSWERYSNKLVDIVPSRVTPNKLDSVELFDIKSDSFTGQAVYHDNHCVYLGLIPIGSSRGDKDRFARSRTYNNNSFRF